MALAGFEPLQRSLAIGGAIGLAVTAVAGLLLWLLVRPIAKQQTQQRHAEVSSLVSRARQLGVAAQDAARDRCQRHSRELIERRDADLDALNAEVAAEIEAVKTRIDSERQRIDHEYPERLKRAREEHETTVVEFDRRIKENLSRLAENRDRLVRECQQACTEAEARLLAERDAAWAAMRREWLDGCAKISEAFAQMRSECERLFPDWSVTNFDEWDKPDAPSLAIEFGRATLNLASIKHGLSEDERLRPAETRFEIPTLITLTEQPSLLITAGGPARKKAVELLQAVTLRFLTGQPPGKVRLTLLDPVGLGESLSPLMHLADYDEELIAGRIWTETRDIDEQLHRLTDHMETVIQKYLRNEYDTIHEYNAQAGEVAEPFQVLVIADFPNNFTDAAARRLVSLATGGPRCGVYVLGVIDAGQRIPTDFELDDLAADAGAPGLGRRSPAIRLALSGVRAAAAGDRRAPGRRADDRGRSARRAPQPRRRSASRCPSPSSPRQDDFWPATADSELRRAGGPRGRQPAAVPAARQGDVAARAGRRQDRLRQVDAPARPDHQRGPALQPRRGRVLPGRLQEGRRVQEPTPPTSCRTPG